MGSCVRLSCIGHVRYKMAPMLSGQTSIFGVVFFVPILRIERQKKPKKFTLLTRNVRILKCGTWPIPTHHAFPTTNHGIRITKTANIYRLE